MYCSTTALPAASPSVSSYVEAKDNREKVDIAVLNAEISQTVAKINALRADIDTILKEIEA